MWLVRPVRPADLDALTDLAEALGPGMTTFPADRTTLAAKVESSVCTFAGAPAVDDAQYLLVLEDLASTAVLGTAAVYPRIGSPYGFFSYRTTRLIKHSRELNLGASLDVLHLSNDYTGMTEVGTLAVHPKLRRSGAGRLLAKSRYVLMAAFPHLFADRIIAEMRGWQDEAGESPFWTAVGERFFKMDFAQADRLSAVEGAAFIADLMPKHPIYLDLLPEEARVCVGKPHAASAPAMAMLQAEGFHFEGLVDVFDAGPQVVAPRQSIRTVQSCRPVEVSCATQDDVGQQAFLLGSTSLEYFGIVPAAGKEADGRLAVPGAALRALELGSGDAGLCVPDERDPAARSSERGLRS